MEACTFVIVVSMAFAGISTAIIQWWQRPPSPSEDAVIKELMKRLDDETLEYCVIRHNADRAPDSDDEDWINSIVDDSPVPYYSMRGNDSDNPIRPAVHRVSSL